MPSFLPIQDPCGATCGGGAPCEPCVPCTTNVTANVPGPAGADGADGADGTDGINAYTDTTALFIMPALQANVTVAVHESSWMTVGQMLYVEGAGYMSVVSKPDDLSVVLKNEESIAGAYASNAVPGVNILDGSNVSPAGLQGLVGPAGADGGEVLTFRTVSVAGADAVLNTDGMILVSAAGDVTLAMITAVGRTGESFVIKRSASMSYGVTINANGGETIDGAVSIVLMQAGEAVKLISNGANWFII